MKTVTVLTFELPIHLSERLRRAGAKCHGMSLQDVALTALEEWLERHEGTDDRRSTVDDRRSTVDDRRSTVDDRRSTAGDRRSEAGDRRQ